MGGLLGHYLTPTWYALGMAVADNVKQGGITPQSLGMRPAAQAQAQAPRPFQRPAQAGGLVSAAATGTPRASAAPAAAGSTAPVAVPGANDPAYLAYMRQMGVEEADINTLTGFRVGALTRQLGRALPAYAERRETAVRDTGRAYEDRGMYSSGARHDAQAEAGRAIDRERLDFEAGIRDEIGEMYLTTAMDIASLRRQLMERGLDYAAADVIARAEAGL